MSQNLLAPEITRVAYQKRHSLVSANDLLAKNFSKSSRPLSWSGLPRLRSKSQNDMKNVSSLVFRVILIGSKGVGKSSIVHRYLTNTFSEAYRPTVSDIYEKTVMRSDGDVQNMFKIYDTAGDLQYEFPAMFNITVAEGDMFALVYSVENRKSFEGIKSLWENIVKLKEDRKEALPFVVVANKADVSATRRKVSEDEGRQLSEEIDCPYVEVSAKTGFKVESIYNHLLEVRDTMEKGKSNEPVPLCAGRTSRCYGMNTDMPPDKELEFSNQQRPALKGKVKSCIVM